MVVPFQIYRHFKGGLYLTIAIALEESSGEPTVIYMSLNGDNKVWSRKHIDFISLVPEGRENPTGQRNRFELVTDITSVLAQCSTENLIKELKTRPDSPFNELDVEGLNDRVAMTEFVVGEIKLDNEIPYFVCGHSADTLIEAKDYLERHFDKFSSRTKIYKSVLIEAE